MMWLPLSHGADVNATDHHGKGDMFPLNYMLYHDRDVVAPALEGRLTRGDEYAERQLQAVGDSLGHDEHIRVEEADGPVTRQLIRRLARLEEELEGCMEDGAESRGGARVERLLDSRDEEWEDCVAKALVELIGEAVWTGSCSNTALAEHMLQLCQREASPPLFNVRCKTGCEAWGRGC
jgi:hypothetical protein